MLSSYFQFFIIVEKVRKDNLPSEKNQKINIHYLEKNIHY